MDSCSLQILNDYQNNLYNVFYHLGPTQVKWRFLISSIFDAMNFQHILEMLEIMLQPFQKMLEIHCITNARNQLLTFDLRWALMSYIEISIWI